MRLFAVVETLSAGYDIEIEKLKSLSFDIGDKHEVYKIEINGCYTDVYLMDYKGKFNSMFFNFETEDGKEFDIFNKNHFLIKRFY